MKSLSRCFPMVVLLLVMCVAGAFAETAPAAAPAAPSLFDWFMANKTAVFGVALAISEFLSIIPAFKGNGILDTIIKALQTLSGKEQEQK